MCVKGSELLLQQKAATGTSVVEDERRGMLFQLNMEQFTCILRQQAIFRYVEERVGVARGVECS